MGELFANPRHPYTQGLIRSIPRIDTAATRKPRLEAIAGVVPSLLAPPPGCRFAPRCRYAAAVCVEAVPPLREIKPGHKVACVRESEIPKISASDPGSSPGQGLTPGEHRSSEIVQAPARS